VTSTVESLFRAVAAQQHAQLAVRDVRPLPAGDTSGLALFFFLIVCTLGGFLSGYRGLTREAYTLDLRQFTTWCRAHSLPLSPSAAPTSSRSPATWEPGAGPARPSPGGCAPSPGSTSTRSKKSSSSIPSRARPPSAGGL
jgi:hypothetical protein